jgi:hypothetical protein
MLQAVVQALIVLDSTTEQTFSRRQQADIKFIIYNAYHITRLFTTFDLSKYHLILTTELRLW